jgi:parallel beta-helix repeat protein
MAPPPPVPQPSPSPTAREASCVEVRPDIDFQSVIDANPSGSTFCVRPGTYRLATPLVPRTGDKFYGEPGSVLNGSKLLTQFVAHRGRWVAENQTQRGQEVGVCNGAYRGCIYPDAVFLDDKPLWRVTSLAELSSGEFFLSYDESRIYLADDPSGRKIEAAVAAAAFLPKSPAGEPKRGVVVSGLLIEKFANPAQHAAIEGRGGTDWVIVSNEVRLNHGVGICGGSGSVVRNNHVHHNGHMGLCASGRGIRIEGNEIAFNNTAGFSTSWSGGGAKWGYTDGLVASGNYSHDNKGPGMWSDGDNVNTVYEKNRIVNNEGPGIVHEISYDAVIRGNTIRGNGFGPVTTGTAALGGGPGIYIVNSANVMIEGNVVLGNRNGVVLKQSPRESAQGAYVLRNVVVSGNAITMATGVSGLLTRMSDSSQPRDKGIRFSNNTYQLSGDAELLWLNVPQSISQWQAGGRDRSSTFATGPEVPHALGKPGSMGLATEEQ